LRPRDSRSKRDPELVRYAREHRKNQTPAEAAFWELVRAKRLGVRWKRQFPISYSDGRYILDFYCPSRKLAVEIDGEYHNSQREYDERRTQWLATHGIRVLRFTNQQVLENPEVVIKVLEEAR